MNEYDRFQIPENEEDELVPQETEAFTIKSKSDHHHHHSSDDSQHRSSSHHKHHHSSKKKKKKTGLIVACVILVIVAVLGVTGWNAYKEMQVLRSQASELKTQLSATVDALSNEDPDSAGSALEEVISINGEMKEEMDKPLMKFASVVPGVGSQIKSANTLLEIVDETANDIIQPAIETIRNNPMSNLKVGEDGFSVSLINSYLDLTDQIIPAVTEVTEKLNTVKLSFYTEQIDQYKQTLNNIMEEYEEVVDYLPIIRAVLGDGSDRYYLFPIQNTAEIRACGGFPGSIGSITISGGVLTIGDFETPYNIFPTDEGEGWSATDEEIEYFSNNVTVVRDAGFNPDFSRVAYIWAMGKEAQSGQHVDGVISMTPVMVQNMLSTTGQSITLSDGTVLDGTNAVRYLQYDIYDIYFQAYGGNVANEITDALFAETAEKAMTAFVSSFSLKNVISYMPLLSDGIEDRTLMFWFANEDEENVAKSTNCAGSLNNGIDNAQVGVFFSISGNKSGWFIDINNEIIDQQKNEDGTTTYHVQTQIMNNITQDVIDQQNPYILNAERNGVYASYVQISAPFGSTVSDISYDGGEMSVGTYAGAPLIYNLGVVLYPQSGATFTYTITTAADVDEEMTFVTTPTLTKYRS